MWWSPPADRGWLRASTAQVIAQGVPSCSRATADACVARILPDRGRSVTPNFLPRDFNQRCNTSAWGFRYARLTGDLVRLTRCKSARLTPTEQESHISRAEPSEQVPPAARSLPNFARLTVSLWEQCGSFSTPGFAPSRVHKLPRRTPSCRSPTCRTPSRPSTTYAYSATVAKSGEQVRLAALTWRLSPTSPGLRDSGAPHSGSHQPRRREAVGKS